MASIWQRMFSSRRKNTVRNTKTKNAGKKNAGKNGGGPTAWNRYLANAAKANRVPGNAYRPSNKPRVLAELDKAIGAVQKARATTARRVQVVKNRGGGAEVNALANRMNRDAAYVLSELQRQRTALAGADHWMPYPMYVSRRPGRPVGVRKNWVKLSNDYDAMYKQLLTMARPKNSTSRRMTNSAFSQTTGSPWTNASTNAYMNAHAAAEHNRQLANLRRKKGRSSTPIGFLKF